MTPLPKNFQRRLTTWFVPERDEDVHEASQPASLSKKGSPALKRQISLEAPPLLARECLLAARGEFLLYNGAIPCNAFKAL